MAKQTRLPIEIVGGFTKDIPVDVRAMSDTLGLKIVETSLADDISGSIGIGRVAT